MTGEEIIKKITSSREDVEKGEMSLGDAVIHVSPENVHPVAKYLKEDPELNFHYLSALSGVDYLDQDRDPRFEAIYELHSFDQNHSIRIRVGVPEENLKLPTVIDLWPSATYPERELFDMLGFHIEGHPNLKRLLMPEEWEGHPHRRDYELTTETVAFSHNIDYKKELVKEKEPIRYRPDLV